MNQSLAVSTPQFEYSAGTSDSFDQKLDRLRAVYQLEDPNLVIDYLQHKRYLAPLLLAAVAPLRSAFGADTVLKLRTLCDEEACTLHASVLWTGDLEPAQACLNDFDNAWWLDRSLEAQGNLVIDFEFV